MKGNIPDMTTPLVLFIMLDGLRPDAISPERTPTLTKVIAEGASTLKAQSVFPSITVPCHTSIFHSVPPQKHGIMDNDWHDVDWYSKDRPITGLVEHLKANDKKTGFIYNWDHLRHLTRPGHLYFNYCIDTGYALDDSHIVEQSIMHLKNPICDFYFIYFSSIDMAGHVYEWMSEDYLKQVSIVDSQVATILEHMPEDAVAIIHADHGGHEREHGTDMPEDMTIPYMIYGAGVKQGQTLERAINLLDTAPTVAHLLGIQPHGDWQGTAITEAFEGE